jgi:hypothetical protein
MEADWEIEVGGEAPVIDALWPGFTDLRLHPERARQLPETAQFPALAAALAKLNADASPVWTSKCDFWPVLEPGEFDPDELDAPSGCAAYATGCYIDLLPRGDERWTGPALAADACKQLCGLLRAVRLHCCRVDLVIRRAIIVPNRMDLGMTAYLTACGLSATEATQRLQAALTAFADVICSHSTLQWESTGE